MIQPASVEQLRRAVRGSVMLPGDPAYEAARPVWNGIIDKRPPVIVRASGTSDVFPLLMAS